MKYTLILYEQRLNLVHSIIEEEYIALLIKSILKPKERTFKWLNSKIKIASI